MRIALSILALLCVSALLTIVPDTAASRSACAFPSIPDEATIIGVNLSGGEAMANVYFGDPDAPLGVIDVEIEEGDTPIFLFARSSISAIWRILGDTKRVVGGAFIGNVSLTTAALTPPGVVGLDRSRVTIFPPRSCDLRALPNVPASHWSRDRFREATGRDFDIILNPRTKKLSKIGIPSGSAFANRTKRPYHFPDTILMDLRPEAAKYWDDFLKIYPAGIVDIDPSSVVTARPVSKYDRLPGAPGLAQLISEGALTLTDAPPDLADWQKEIGPGWAGLSYIAFNREARLAAMKSATLRTWWFKPLATAIDFYSPEAPNASLHGNQFRVDESGSVEIETETGDWVRPRGAVLLVHKEFELPPAIPGKILQPLFLLPSGVPEPSGTFGSRTPLLREIAD